MGRMVCDSLIAGVYQICSVGVRGGGALGGLRVSSSEHMAHFFAAAEWLAGGQRARGGWPVLARRHVAPGVPDLKPGWSDTL